MIIFLYGPDTYRSQQKLREIIECYKKIRKSGLNLRYFNGSSLNFQDFKDEFRTSPMFAEKKLFVVKNAFLNSKFKEKFLEEAIFFRNSKDIILFYEENTPQNDLFFKFLKENGRSQEFGLLSVQKLRNWLRKEFKKYGVEIENETIEKLINFVGNDLWRLSQEVKKIVNYIKSKDKKVVRIEEIELLVKPKIETNIFKTINAIATKNKKFCLKLIHQHLEKGDSPFYLFSMFNFQFRNLLIIKSKSTNGIRMLRINDLNKKLEIHPYVIKKAIWQSEKFSLKELKKIYQRLFEADLNVKTGKLDAQTALDLLIAEI